MNNVFIYHLHSDYSSCVTNIDSATKAKMYIEKAKEIGMTALAFSEHGCALNWYEKKASIEDAGMKYVHAAEIYITESLDEKVRDNYHTVLIAKNYDGVKEINRLISKSFNREDGHYYYVPRISIDEFCGISNNIITTSACLASPLSRGTEHIKGKYIDFISSRPELSFLEIQHHNVDRQKEYNNYLLKLSKETGLKLVTGTDTHSLNKELAEAREILQKAKNIYFGDEEGWDLTFKGYDSLVESYKYQNSIPINIVLEAIDNTNLIESMVESFELDKSPKYPKLYDNSEEVFTKMVYDSIETHPYALKNHTRTELRNRVESELEVYKKTGTIDFMLFQKFVRDKEHSMGVFTGPGRGSVSGSMIAYLLGITEMDSLRFNLNMWRFLNPERVSQADVDSDYYEPERNKIREFLLNMKELKTTEIVAFSTIALKGAVRDVGRALNIPLHEVSEICDSLILDEKKDFIAPEKLKNKYRELFRFADLLNGVIVTCGTHPAGILISSNNIEEEIGTFTIKGTKYPVSCLDMYGLDANSYVKFDMLG